jgi:hypothetical protein
VVAVEMELPGGRPVHHGGHGVLLSLYLQRGVAEDATRLTVYIKLLK